MRYFIINAKNYLEISGPSLRDFCKTLKEVSSGETFKEKVEFFLAPPNFGLSSAVTHDSSYKVISEHLDSASIGPSTGYSVPEVAKSFGAQGSIVNHSEHRIAQEEIKKLIPRLRSLEMISVVCAKDDEEVGVFSKMDPDFIAVEPPDLIGSGKAVSKERPGIITGSRSALEANRLPNSSTKLLCGAGIVEGVDARLAVEMGADGILVASGVIKAANWTKKIQELARGLTDAKVPER